MEKSRSEKRNFTPVAGLRQATHGLARAKPGISPGVTAIALMDWYITDSYATIQTMI